MIIDLLPEKYEVDGKYVYKVFAIRFFCCFPSPTDCDIMWEEKINI